MRLIYELINRRAKAAWDADHRGEPCAANWKPWVQCWLEQANRVYDEFDAEGLTDTAAEVIRVIADAKRWEGL
jgi:hypothetical protein